ncbi:hypothetical protein ZWY2020_027887 [Hordeum vulgare]|nr:hypothetical protein ZWY2020_027887 [Hordeum vulgare]
MPGAFDDLLADAAATCTHAHLQPPGPSAAMHTHTCLHTHTHQLFAAGSGTTTQRSPGARWATGRPLQGHATLEAEVARLRGLLSDVRAKIDAEVVAGAFPFQKQCSVGSVACTDPTLCFNNGNSEVGGACWGDSSGPASADCGLDEDANGGAAREIDAPGQPVRAMDVVELCFPS